MQSKCISSTEISKIQGKRFLLYCPAQETNQRQSKHNQKIAVFTTKLYLFHW